jgi:hypothetical protein
VESLSSWANGSVSDDARRSPQASAHRAAPLRRSTDRAATEGRRKDMFLNLNLAPGAWRESRQYFESGPSRNATVKKLAGYFGR